ncbi:hypothetical protein T12_254 [Trichinella patagoniensis]|uniref:Uncharacterized protein n=1 Tax=Trichinella patagoniensis TaxID=990121 RepID=A0A0V1AEP2_9BILA|nr:hypothetical protein T12_254 [Trichinella patagoniensis]
MFVSPVVEQFVQNTLLQHPNVKCRDLLKDTITIAYASKPMIPPVMFSPNISTIPQIILYFTGFYSVHNKNAVFTKDINLINTKDHFKYRFTLKVLC